MARYIDADELIQLIAMGEGTNTQKFKMKCYVELSPTADVVSRSEGRWTYGVDRGDTMKCTLCRRRMPKIDNARYCPNCGAKMKGGE